MSKIAAASFALVLLSSVSASSQDALATFVFLFFDSSAEVTHNYGTEFAPNDVDTLKIAQNCIFELHMKNPATHSELQLIQRWDFNKAFFSESKVDRGGNIIIPGERGVFQQSDFCEFKNAGSANSFYACSQTAVKQTSYDGVAVRSANERKLKALDYFAKNFCAGAKRKSAF